MTASSTCHKRESYLGRTLGRALLLLSAALTAGPVPCRALDSQRTLTQYVRSRWGPANGLPANSVNAITQTKDGYLWVGTDQGLFRFDGQKFHQVGNDHAALRPVLGLTAENDGGLWIRLSSPQLLRYRQQTFQSVQDLLGEPGTFPSAMTNTASGALLLWTRRGGHDRVLLHENDRFRVIADLSQSTNSPILAMKQLPNQELWVGMWDAGLLRVRGNESTLVRQGLPDAKVNCLLAHGRQEVWVGTDDGILRWDGAALTASGLPAEVRHIRILSLISDQDGNVWAGTSDHGLIRIDPHGIAAVEYPTRNDTAAVSALFEDREGNLWAGRPGGVERIRDSAFITYDRGLGMSGPVYADRQNRLWTATATGGLCWLQDGREQCLDNPELRRDVVYAIEGEDDHLLLGMQRGGLIRLRPSRGGYKIERYTKRQGLAQDSVYALHRSADGSIWVGTLSGGVSRVSSSGAITNYSQRDGLAANTITSIAETNDRAMWFGTRDGLSSFTKDGIWHTYTARDNLASEDITNLLSGRDGVLWIGTAAGLSYARNGTIHAIRQNMLSEAILGIAEDEHGALWLSTSSRVLQMNRASLLSNVPLAPGDWREYGPADGLQSVEGIHRSRAVVKDSSGRIWFSQSRGLSAVDPQRLTSHSAPALTVLESVQADGVNLNVNGTLRIPPGCQRLRFEFVSLTLSRPEKVRFRYMLEGFDRQWSDSLQTNEAVFTNLDPGPYRFRVISSNPEGVWDTAGVDLPFAVLPAVWQTWWCRSLFLLFVFGSVMALYTARLRSLSHSLNMRFEERLAERTRIARDLHDTLLQGLLSASMQLHVAADRLPDQTPAKPQINRVLALMGRVTEEGRNALRGLRSTETSANSLEASLSVALHEFGERGGQSMVGSKGRVRAIHPIVCDEIYHIAREALANAVHHAQATEIQADLTYATRQLRLSIRDNGIGIDPVTLKFGRDGHWGLAGMRERARRIHGNLQVSSRTGAGTEISVAVPGYLAYLPEQTDGLRAWLQRLIWRRLSNAKFRDSLQ